VLHIKNPILAARLTDALKQKVSNQTKLNVVNSDNAHYIVSGYVSNDAVTLAGISAQQASTNRLTVTVHITLVKTLENNKTEESDASWSFDFNANLDRQQVETSRMDDIVKNVTDAIF